jgi:hypothetical protein
MQVGVTCVPSTSPRALSLRKCGRGLFAQRPPNDVNILVSCTIRSVEPAALPL